MFKAFIIFCLCSWSRTGVFGVSVKSVSVTEGESVTLNPDLTGVQRDDEIQWKFIGILIAQNRQDINKSKFYNDAANARFRDRLKVDQNRSLTITDTRINHSGLYTVSSSKGSLHTFNLTVYTRLPAPVITLYCLQNPSSSSVSRFLLLCSVENVHHVTLSWFRGNSVLSSISVSDLNRNIYLHLEFLNDSYSCVVNNPIRNQTTHPNNTELCQTCAEVHVSHSSTEAPIRLILSALVGVAIVAVLFYVFRSCSLQLKRRERKSLSYWKQLDTQEDRDVSENIRLPSMNAISL